MAKDEIIAAIRQAAQALGRAPSRGELKRLTGVSHYRVLSEFRTLRQAVRAAGLEPNPKGERISTGDLIKDWKRVAGKLGRKPSRAEYVREGKYSAGALTVRFGSWGRIGESPTGNAVEDTLTNAQASDLQASNRQTSNRQASNQQARNRPAQEGARTAIPSNVENGADKAIAMRWAASLTQLPGELAGKRRVTEAVAQLVVNTLLGEGRSLSALSLPQRARNGDTATQRAEIAGGGEASFLATREITQFREGAAAAQPQEADTAAIAMEEARAEAYPVKVGVRKDRAIMGPPFDASRLTNAPMNELGVVFLFGMMAAELGFQVESLQGRFPDCEAKREVHPGKWQRSRIEFEYESKNFALHGHDPRGCDVIVCWRHNWAECPEGIEVVELSSVIQSLANAED